MKPILQKVGLLIAMLLAILPMSAYDFEAPAGYNGMQKLQYNILSSVDQTVAVVGGTTGIIPCTVTYNNKTYTVTEIGRFAFSDEGITSFRLPVTLKTIRENAFGFTTASIIAVPDAVETIESGAFWCSSIETIIIGKSVKTIGDGAFYQCGVKTLVFKSEKAPSHYSRGYPIGNSSTTVIVPQLKEYEGSSLSEANSGSIIEPIYFKSNEYEYSGNIPELDYVLKIASASPQSDMSLKNKNAGTYQQSFYIGLSSIIPSYSFSDLDGYATFPDRGLDVKYNYTINQKALNLVIDNQSRIYGDSNPSKYSYTIDGFVNGEDESVFTTPVRCSTLAEINSPVGDYPITGVADALNYSFNIQNGKLTVQKAPLELSIISTTRLYGDSNPQFEYSLNGLKCGETNPEVSQPLQFKSCEVSSDCGQYPISLISGEFKNYIIQKTTPGVLSVTKAPLILTAKDASRLYYEKNPQFDFSLDGLRNNDDANCITTTPQYACTATLVSDCGSYDIVPSGATAKNYEIAYRFGKLTITPATLTLKANDASREYGDVNTVFTFNGVGLKGGQSVIEVLSEQPTLTTAATAASSAGQYPIMISGGKSKNYQLSYQSGILTVTKAPLTVIADNVERVYGENNPAFSRSYLGFKLEDTESTAFSQLPKLNCAATQRSDAGNYPISISGGITKNYDIVEYTPGVLTVTKAPLTLTAKDASRLYYDNNPQFDFSLDGLRNNDSKSVITSLPTYICSAELSSNAGYYDIIPSSAQAKNYEIGYRNGQLTINKRSLTASTGTYTRHYGESNPEFEIVYSGFVNGEDVQALSQPVEARCTANETTDVGSYPIELQGGNSPNYEITKYNSGKLIIEKANQEIIWNQDLSNINMGSQIALTAESSSGLAVYYEMSPNNVATLYSNGGTWYLDCYASGAVNIRANQPGDKNHNTSDVVTKTLVVFGGGGSDPSNPQIYLHVEDPGSLPSLIAENRKYQIKNLRLSGYLNGTDINYIREMAGSDAYGNTTAGVLELLDISSCTIVPGGRSYFSKGTSCYTTNNYIGDYMFYNCKVLTNLLLPSNATVIEDYAFADCSRLSVLSIPNGVTSFGTETFRNDIGLLRIPMPENLTSIGDKAFMGCNNLTEIDIPANVFYIGDGIVKDCENISRINVDASNQYFASKDGVLFDYEYTTLKIFPVNNPSSIYKVMNGVTRIAPYSFVNAKKLTEVTLPSSLLTIGTDAFIGCVNLNILHTEAIAPPVCDNDCFESVSKTRCELQVPQGCYNAYWVAPVWSEFNKIVENVSSSINDVSRDNIEVSVDGLNIMITGTPNDIYVRIYQMNGLLIYQQRSNGENISYQLATPGTYIVAVGNKTFKILVK